MKTTNLENTVDTADWKSLYRIAGAAAVAMVAFIPIQIIVFVLWPPPSTVMGWFALFQENKLVGLLDLDLLLMVDQIFSALILLALYVTLRRTHPAIMTIALTFGLIGIAVYFASTVAFEMLSLSDQYAAATTELERSSLLAAGQGMLVTRQGVRFQFRIRHGGHRSADDRTGNAPERDLQQANRLDGNRDGRPGFGTADSAVDWHGLRVLFAGTFDTMEHLGCPEALPTGKDVRCSTLTPC
jgi:hypothetical protein